MARHARTAFDPIQHLFDTSETCDMDASDRFRLSSIP